MKLVHFYYDIHLHNIQATGTDDHDDEEKENHHKKVNVMEVSTYNNNMKPQSYSIIFFSFPSLLTAKLVYSYSL